MHFFNGGLAHGNFPADPTAGVKAGRRTSTQRHLRDKLTDEEIARLLGLASLTARSRALIWLALFTAARSVELWRADIEDLRTCEPQMLLFVCGKGRSEKDEPLVIAAKSARDAIRDYLAELAEAGHRSGALFVTEREFGGQRQRISRRTLRRAIRDAFNTAGRETFSLAGNGARSGTSRVAGVGSAAQVHEMSVSGLQRREYFKL